MGQVIDIAGRGKRARTNTLRNVPPGRAKNVDLRSRELRSARMRVICLR